MSEFREKIKSKSYLFRGVKADGTVVSLPEIGYLETIEVMTRFLWEGEGCAFHVSVRRDGLQKKDA